MRLLRRFIGLPATDRRLLLSAALVLSLVGVALRLVSFKKLIRLSDVLPKKPSKRNNILSPSSERIVWAISVMSRRMPVASRCLTQAVAAKILLARWGYPVLLRIGVGKGQNGRLEAHAWVERQGVVVVGAPASSRFTVLPRFDGDDL
ncbi:MAG: lasso peptide biosynthesis B2 protein [Desulfomonilaceae bacterium]